MQTCESLLTEDNDAPDYKKAKYVVARELDTPPPLIEEEKYSSHFIFVEPGEYHPKDGDLRLPIHPSTQMLSPHFNHHQIMNFISKEASKNGR